VKATSLKNLLKYMILKKMNLHCFYIPRVPLPLQGCDAYNGLLSYFLRKNHQSMYRYDPDDRILCFVPFSHGFGSISVLIPALAYKAGIVFQKTFHPAKVAEAVIKENITHMLGVPTITSIVKI